MSKEKKTEINILSGFLGSGKTTLLQRLLKNEETRKRKVGVIMNEIGQVSIDSAAIPENTPLKELLNGCVCCTLSDKLEVQMYDLLENHNLDVVYIETTGVAHPLEVLDACLSPLLADKINIGTIISVIDASGWSNRHSFKRPLQKLITEQAKHADVIVLNKVDLISDEKQEEVMNELHALNQTGKIVTAEFTNIDVNSMTVRKTSKDTAREKVHATEHLHIKTYVHTFENPVNKNRFEEFLRNMPENVYRIKGYIRFEGDPATFLFQYAYGVPYHTNAGIKMKELLVFIGDELDHEVLRKLLLQLEHDLPPNVTG
ncbi:GTP-binding protein [Aeromicrobium ponti]|uniref:G3E family GTPase n=1 Tax=Cytobacillus oceanisediminis TaxID=665099 RepID=A0A562JJE9_9BACI|nr:GTP-binding protein [Cytobacillus oceanisediminis]TWH83125.1 G3E family GTPase [Cytobacillus oceanisediminis]